jgi:hypothetical protein
VGSKPVKKGRPYKIPPAITYTLENISKIGIKKTVINQNYTSYTGNLKTLPLTVLINKIFIPQLKQIKKQQKIMDNPKVSVAPSRERNSEFFLYKDADFEEEARPGIDTCICIYMRIRIYRYAYIYDEIEAGGDSL